MKLWAILSISVSCFTTNASAGLLCTSSTPTSCTQVVNMPLATAAGNGSSSGSATFNLFGSIGAPAGSTLDSVSLQIVIRESLTALQLGNTGTTPMNSVTVTDSAYFDAGNTADASDGSLLDAALPNSLNLHRTAATIANLSVGTIGVGTFTCGSGSPCSLPKTLSKDTGVISGTTSSYAGSGQFDLSYSAFASISLTGSNPIKLRLTSVTNSTDATATVVYNFTTPTPEPASVVLFGSGLLACAWIGRQRLRRKLR